LRNRAIGLQKICSDALTKVIAKRIDVMPSFEFWSQSNEVCELEQAENLAFWGLYWDFDLKRENNARHGEENV